MERVAVRHHANLRRHFQLSCQLFAHLLHVQINATRRLGNKVDCAKLERTQRGGSTFARFRTDNHDRPRILRHDQFSGLKAVHVRHVDVHGDHVGTQRFRERYGIATVARLPCHFELRIGIDDFVEDFAHVCGIVHNEHSKFFFCAFRHFNSAAPVQARSAVLPLPP